MNFFAYVGAWVVLILSFGLGLTILNWFQEKSAQRFERKVALIVAASEHGVLHKLGQRIDEGAYWFGESPETASALHLIGGCIVMTGSFDVDRVREAWREQRTLAAKEALK